MSRPGDPGRRQIVAEGFEQILTTTADAVGSIPGAVSFEVRHDAADRELADDEEPRPDERIRWTVTATLRRKHGSHRFEVEVSGTSVAEPGEHARGISMACVQLLERLGANTVVLDPEGGA